MIPLIELAVPVITPNITYLKICSWKFEVSRPELDKNGFIDIWLAQCYLEDGLYKESPLPGINIKLENAAFDELIATPTTVKDFMTDSIEILMNFLLDYAYLEGSVVFVE